VLDGLEAAFRTKTTLKEICLRFLGHDGDDFVGLPADIYEWLNGLKKHGLHITVARYKGQSRETGRSQSRSCSTNLMLYVHLMCTSLTIDHLLKCLIFLGLSCYTLIEPIHN
jgi:hypothetical protein